MQALFEDSSSPHPYGTYGVGRPGGIRRSTALHRRYLISMGSIFLSQVSTRR
jgi:hypothetical protein